MVLLEILEQSTKVKQRDKLKKTTNKIQKHFSVERHGTEKVMEDKESQRKSKRKDV